MIDAALIGWAQRIPDGSQLGPAPLRVQRDVVQGVGLWAIDAAREVMGTHKPTARTGLYVAMGGLRPGWDELMPRLATQQGGPPWAQGLRRFHPFWMLRNLSNNVHATLAAELQITTDGATYTGEASGGVALQAAIEALHLRVVDRALVVAYDSLLQPEIRVERNGPLAEAAAAILLEREGSPRIAVGPTEVYLESPYGAAQLLLDVIRLRHTGGRAGQHARPGTRIGVRVGTCEAPVTPSNWRAT